MVNVRSSGNVATELRLIAVFRKHGITGWRRRERMFGHPDFVFRHSRVAVFVDGCFWHGCRKHGAVPRTRAEFWEAKIDRNRRRDVRVRHVLTDLGWTVIRLWQ